MLRVRAFLVAFLLALAGFAAPAHAQASTEVILQLDGDSLLANELGAASRKVRAVVPTRNTPFSPGIEVTGSRLLIRVGDSRKVEAAIPKLKEALEGYDIALRIDGAIEASLTDATLAHRLNAAGASALSAAYGRLERSGHSDVKVARQNVTQLRVTVPSYEGKSVEDVVALLTKPGVVTFNLVDDQIDGYQMTLFMPQNGRVALPDDSQDGAPQVVHTEPIVGSDGFASARAALDLYNNPSISFELTPGATQVFGRATTQFIGRRFAIVLDGRIVSAPTIHSPILGGNGQITGQFTMAEAERLAAILDSPPMPARLVVVETRVADPPR